MNAYIKDKALLYVKRFGTRNPFVIADALDVKVFKFPLGRIDGYYQYLKKHRCIYVNSELDSHFADLVMSHELGHAVLHRVNNCYFMEHKTLLDTSRIEREANIFAAELLIDDKELNEYIHMEYTIEQIARIYGYNQELVKLKTGI